MSTRRRPFDYAGSTALVTGASRGIGAAIARSLARRGIGALVLSARSASDLDALAAEIRAARPGLRVETIPANLAEAHAPARIKETADRLGLTVDLLVNNAGFGSHGAFETLPVERERDMVAVNVDAVVALTGLYYPGMLARGRGGVLNVASTAAFQPVPFMTTYGATKAFVLSFSEGLWAECREHSDDPDVRVVALCPGGTETDFGDGMHRGRFESAKQSTPEEVAESGLEALDRNASFAVVGAGNYVGTLGARLFPRATIAGIAADMFRPAGFGEAEKKSGAPYTVRTAAAIGAGLAVVGVGAALLLRRSRR
jgi:short-subunit dehydrogenase